MSGVRGYGFEGSGEWVGVGMYDEGEREGKTAKRKGKYSKVIILHEIFLFLYMFIRPFRVRSSCYSSREIVEDDVPKRTMFICFFLSPENQR